MRLRVLGSAAGGGFPQWNCACRNCDGVRRGTVAAVPRTQASLAVSADGERWLILGASPDVRAQLAAAPSLWPSPPRRSPLAAVAIGNGDLDAWLGLLSLREWTPLTILTTATVRRDIVDGNQAARTLDRFAGQSRWIDLEARAPVPVDGLTIEAVPVAGKPPLHARRAPDALDNVGFVVRDERSSVAWFPSVAAPSPELERALVEADAIFFDGTFYRDDELAAAGVGEASARALAHWPVADSAAFLAAMPARTKLLVHVNNTNPLLVDDGRERAELRALGIEVARDGQELTL